MQGRGLVLLSLGKGRDELEPVISSWTGPGSEPGFTEVTGPGPEPGIRTKTGLGLSLGQGGEWVGDGTLVRAGTRKGFEPRLGQGQDRDLSLDQPHGPEPGDRTETGPGSG